MGEQLEHWKGQVGDAYWERNPYEPRSAVPYYERIANGRDICSVLEVGCNLGSKLGAWLTVLPEAYCCGIEPNEKAAEQARAIYGVFEVKVADAYEIPYADESFDLVFTSGVLMHVPPSGIGLATHEIVRVAKKYVLVVEQYSAVEQELPGSFGGFKEMWWSRHYGDLYGAFDCLELLHHEPYREWYFTDTYVWLFGKNGAK